MLVFTAIALMFAGCDKEEPECSENVACGFGETCIKGVCTSRDCATSLQCDMENQCVKGNCEPGCASDDDCYPGDYCNSDSQTCEQAPCTDSHVDCGFKEYCNTVTGECIEASGYFCRDCELDADCGGNGNVCMHWGLERDFCGVSCEVESDCPSGFTCLDWSDEDGNPTRQCATYCWLYISDRPVPPGQPAAPGECAMEDR